MSLGDSKRKRIVSSARRPGMHAHAAQFSRNYKKLLQDIEFDINNVMSKIQTLEKMAQEPTYAEMRARKESEISVAAWLALRLQEQQQKVALLLQVLSNVMKMSHEMASAIIRNIK